MTPTAKLFDRRARLMRDLATVNAQIDAARKAHSYARGLKVPMRIEQFMREYRDVA